MTVIFMKKEFKNILLFAVLSTILCCSEVLAVAPGIPQQFFGSVSINGAPASDGTTVSAKISGVVVSTGIATGGKYGHSQNIFYIDDPNSNRAGSIIQFFVNGVDTGATAYFANGKSTQLDLSVAIASQNNQNTNAGSGSSGGGGGGSSATNNNIIASNDSNNAASTATTPEGPCKERWTCNEWSSCKDGIQKRSCIDANKCGTIDDLPLASQPCSLEDVAVANDALAAQEKGQNLISGLFLSATSSQGILFIIFGALVIYFGFQYFRKNGSRKY